MTMMPESNQPARGLRDFGAFQPVPQSTPFPQATPDTPPPVQEVTHIQRFPFSYARQVQEIGSRLLRSEQLRTLKVRPRLIEIILRGGVSILALGLLAQHVSWTKLFAIYSRLNLEILLMALALGGAGFLVSTFQWHRLLRAERIRFDLADLIKIALVGYAFRVLPPPNIDDDTMKATYVGKCTNNPTGASSATVLCHITGFLGMLGLSIPAFILRPEQFPLTIKMWFILLSLGAGIAISGMLLISIMLPEMIYSKWLEYRLVRFILRIGNTLCISLNQPRALLVATGYSLLSWTCSILSYEAYMLALGQQLPLSFYCVAVPLVFMIAALPISFHGLGLREVAFTLVFMAAPMPLESAFSLALLANVQTLAFGMLGGYYYYTLGRTSQGIV
ncbi:lysylphosphatidylglycerol synthase transmembrane domain-containing protein [Ktedonospora formicarum]|uniref:Uncharacterized protein n=1 Tax=Ktedonospora formicarum TaxID=2778364 RepID=A0A8J3MS04_9CHLR|nr:lysylphosphatidylglycerol synthase transmembrane domain-containing protein [Ktedonospora formicarum]GHO44351.1 hypothetical protein KSX_25140 [Ktedonospora formicarum]